ncbi:MAG: multidrug ABC transporter substrate-binding protein [Planctomycetota bacterium]|nr:MAG: multidrug ABC transporter substrate-binding protein [Planctomycetota bacterium]
MIFLRIFKMALVSLRANFLRSILATLGVIIGVAAVISAVSVLKGMERDILQRFEALGADQLIVINGSSDRTRRRGVMPPSLTLDDEALIRRKASESVRATCPQMQRPAQAQKLARTTQCTMMGTSDAYASMNSYEPADGRFLEPEDLNGNGAFVCVLGHQVKQDLFGARPAVGQDVDLNGKRFIVRGVMEERGMLGFVEVDNMVFVPVTTLQRMTGARYLDMLVVQAAESRRLSSCLDSVTRILRESHNLRAGEPDDFQILTQEQAKNQLRDVTLIMAVVLYSIAGISLVVGGIGIMNIMMVSVTERTREIGVRIAVGARPVDIWFQFFVEAGVISLLGGALGVVVGYAFSDLLSQITAVLKTYTPPASIVMALAVATFVGLISGLYPAIRAARMDPVEALRFE